MPRAKGGIYLKRDRRAASKEYDSDWRRAFPGGYGRTTRLPVSLHRSLSDINISAASAMKRVRALDFCRLRFETLKGEFHWRNLTLQ